MSRFDKIINAEDCLKNISNGVYNEKIDRIKAIEEALIKEYSEKCNKDKTQAKSLLEEKYTSKDVVKNMSDLMYKMMCHAQNGTGCNGIKLKGYDNKDKETFLKEILFEFNPKKICEKYKSSDKLFNEMDTHSENEEFFKENSRKNWETYAITVYYIAKFLSKFEDLKEFRNVFEGINKVMPYCLPICTQTIPGFGPAFSSDFIKEVAFDGDISFNNLIKPDTHLNHFVSEVFCEINNPMQLHILCEEIAKKLDWDVFKFDKIIYLYCTLDFYRDNVKFKINSTDRRENMIRYVNGDRTVSL